MTDHTRTTALFIDGQWHETARAEPVVNPATGIPVGHVALAEPHDTERAAAAAARAWADWSAVPAKERGLILQRAAERLLARVDEIATLLSQESGKMRFEAEGELRLSAAFLQWYAEEARRAYGTIVENPNPGKHGEVRMEPVGPVLVLTPWNFPVSLLVRKVAPALAAGCTVVARPSNVAPLAAAECIRCFEEAGVPPGVVNFVTGEVADTATPLLSDDRFRAVTFTGSTRVGRTVVTQSAGTLARVALELGGDAPFLVFDDADIDLAVEQALIASTGTTVNRASGRTGCSSRSRCTKSSSIGLCRQQKNSPLVILQTMG